MSANDRKIIHEYNSIPQPIIRLVYTSLIACACLFLSWLVNLGRGNSAALFADEGQLWGNMTHGRCPKRKADRACHGTWRNLVINRQESSVTVTTPSKRPLQSSIGLSEDGLDSTLIAEGLFKLSSLTYRI